MHAFSTQRVGDSPVRRSLSVLDTVQIARPCPADWNAMNSVPGQARARVRHCEDCSLRVYNLSALKRAEAEELLRSSEGRLCIRLYRREDGTVLTTDCSFFRRVADTSAAGARRAAWLATCGLAALMGSAVWASSLIRDPGGNGPRPSIVQSGLDRLAQIRPIDRFISWLSPSPAQGMVPSGWGPPGTFIAGSPAVMGDFAQGEFQPPDPMPRTPPEQWLGSETDQTVPL